MYIYVRIYFFEKNRMGLYTKFKFTTCPKKEKHTQKNKQNQPETFLNQPKNQQNISNNQPMKDVHFC